MPAPSFVPSVLVSLTLACATLPAAAQTPADSAANVQGFLQQDDTSHAWTILTPQALEALGARSFVVSIVGSPKRWSRLLGYYVAASGRLFRDSTGALAMTVSGMDEIEPAGTAHAIHDRGMTQRSKVSLAVIPNRFHWKDSSGRSTGVNPTILYSIQNQRTSPILFVLPTHDLVCLEVRRVNEVPAWDSASQAPAPDFHRFVIQHGGTFRQAFQLPENAAPGSARYVVHARICEVDGFDVTAEFEVL